MEGFDTAGSFGLKVLNARDADRRYTREIAFRTRPPTELLSGPPGSRVRPWDSVSIGEPRMAL